MTMQTTTALKHAVHPSIRDPKPPKPKTRGDLIVAALMRDGLLPFRVSLPEMTAIPMAGFLKDAEAAWGKSGALSPIDWAMAAIRGSAMQFSTPAYATDAGQRAGYVLDRLQDHERELMKWLWTARERASVSLTRCGEELFFVHNDEKLARQTATTAIQLLAKSVWQHYKAPAEYARNVELQRAKKQAIHQARRNGVPLATQV
jgi:hypothetical protein